MQTKNFELTLRKYEPYFLIVLGLIACAWFASAILFELVGGEVMDSRPWSMIQYVEYRDITPYWIACLAGIAPPILFLVIKYMPKPESLYGDARWAREADLKQSKLRTPGGIILGKQGGKYLSTKEPAHFLVCAPTRSGKGVGIIVPNLLDFDGSVIVHDIKFENWKLTSGLRAAHGHKVFLWSPMNPDATTHSYNPLDMIRDDAIFRISDVQAFASYMIPLPKKDPIWDQLARFFFAGLVLYVIDAHRELKTPKTVGEIYRLVNAHTDLNKWIDEVCDLHWLDPECKRLMMSYAGMTDKERSFVRTSCAKVLNLWSNPLVDAATSKSDFDLRDLRKQRTSIYIGASADTKDTVAPLVALFMQQAIGALVQKEPDPKTEPHRVLFMLDEFASMGRMEMVANSVTMLASYGGRLVFILQALSTLDEHYGKDGREVILQNCAYQVFFAASDETTTKYVVGRLGKKTVKSQSTSRSKGNVTKSVKESARDLMLPQEFQGMDRTKGVVLVESGRPVLSDKIVFYEDDDFIARVMEPAPVPLIEIEGNYRLPPSEVSDAEHPGKPSKGAVIMQYGGTPKERPAKVAPTSKPETTVAREAVEAPMKATDALDNPEPAEATENQPEAIGDGLDDDVWEQAPGDMNGGGEVAHEASPVSTSDEAVEVDDGSKELDSFLTAATEETAEVSGSTVAAASEDGRRDLADRMRQAATTLDPDVAARAVAKIVEARIEREAQGKIDETSSIPADGAEVSDATQDRLNAMVARTAERRSAERARREAEHLVDGDVSEAFSNRTSAYNNAVNIFMGLGDQSDADFRSEILKTTI